MYIAEKFYIFCNYNLYNGLSISENNQDYVMLERFNTINLNVNIN